MIAIDTVLFIIGGLVLYMIGFFTAALLGSAKIGDSQQAESYWRQQYFLQKESHAGSVKKYISKLKEADETIHKLSEEKANLQDSIKYYQEAL